MSGFRDQAFFDHRFDHGYWSPTTSSANFCEIDYNVTRFIGEFINTLTNLSYLYFALTPPKLSLRTPGHSSNKGGIVADEVPGTIKFKWDVHTFSLIAVGLMSAMFHLTLRRLPQFLDESSMYILVSGFAFDLLTTNYLTIKGKSVIQYRHRTLTAAVIMLIITTTSIITLVTGDLIIHSVTFGTAVIICGVGIGRLIRKHEPKTRSRLYWHLLSADMTLNVAFALWLVDCSPKYCNVLREFRRHLIDMLPNGLGLLLGFITELHGWWHILTARSAAEFISLIRYITQNAPYRDERDVLKYKSIA